MASTRVITDEELLQLPRDDGNKYEVVDGELRVSPANFAHERIIAKLLARMRGFADQRQLGEVVGSNVLYVLPSGNRRGPDVSFVAAGRLTPEARAQVFPRLAPDLAIEVLSPSDRPRAVFDRVGEYLESGVRLVWVIDPQKRRAVEYRSLSEAREIASSGTLDGAARLPRPTRCRSQGARFPLVQPVCQPGCFESE
jgi:Uma2 family endonuclease